MIDNHIEDEQTRKDLLNLITMLTEEHGEHVPEGADELTYTEAWRLFRMLCNSRQPMHGSDALYDLQDAVLTRINAGRGITRLNDLMPLKGDERLYIWEGDITLLEVDAIVNAANTELLGCWVPEHYCIDNAIHTYAGVQLREECYDLRQWLNGAPIQEGDAKITDAYNLPSQAVIHAVGPNIEKGTTPSISQRMALAACYTEALNLAEMNNLHTVAFPCISTGVFNYPRQEAASIATNAVKNWLDAHPHAHMRVVFTTFDSIDTQIYHELLQ